MLEKMHSMSWDDLPCPLERFGRSSSEANVSSACPPLARGDELIRTFDQYVNRWRRMRSPDSWHQDKSPSLSVPSACSRLERCLIRSCYGSEEDIIVSEHAVRRLL